MTHEQYYVLVYYRCVAGIKSTMCTLFKCKEENLDKQIKELNLNKQPHEWHVIAVSDNPLDIEAAIFAQTLFY